VSQVYLYLLGLGDFSSNPYLDTETHDLVTPNHFAKILSMETRGLGSVYYYPQNMETRSSNQNMETMGVGHSFLFQELPSILI
jgi:hypothetical protein